MILLHHPLTYRQEYNVKNVILILSLFFSTCAPYLTDPVISGIIMNNSGSSGSSVQVAVYTLSEPSLPVALQDLGVISNGDSDSYSLTLSNHAPDSSYILRAWLDKDSDTMWDYDEPINQRNLDDPSISLTLDMSLFPILFGIVEDDSVAIGYDFGIALLTDGIPENNHTASITDQLSYRYTLYFRDSFSYSPVYTIKAFFDINSNGIWDAGLKEPVGSQTKTVTAGNTDIPLANIIISDSNQPPSAVSLITPASNSTGQAYAILTLDWDPVTDPDSDPVTYDLYLGTAPFNIPLVVSSLTNDQYTLSNLAPGLQYYWKIVARDDFLGKSFSSVYPFTTLP